MSSQQPGYPQDGGPVGPQQQPPGSPYGPPGQAPYPTQAGPYVQPAQHVQPGYPPQPVPGAPFPGWGGYRPPPVDFDPAAGPDDLARPLYGATFGQAVSRFFRKFADFSGRASRSEYWWAQLLLGLITLLPLVVLMIGVTGVLFWIADNAPSYHSYSYGYRADISMAPMFGVFLVGLLLYGLVSLALIVPSLALTWRRLHDASLAGPLYFLSYIPSVGSLVLLVLTVLPSKVEGRRFDRAR